MLNPGLAESQALHAATVDDTAMAARLIAQWATPADRAYAAGRRRSDGSLLALAALRALLFAVTGQSGWHVARSTFGKPSVVPEAGQDGPAVSVSHTTGLIGVAVAQGGAIGIDVERHRARNFAALAAQAFGPAEQAEVAAEGPGAFYRIWTLREAMAKATGDGLALAINRHDLADGVAAGRPESRTRLARTWQLFHALPQPGCSLALARIGGEVGASPHWVDLSSMPADPCC